MTDQTIVEHLRSGEHSKPLDRLYTHFPSIKHMVVTHGGSEEDAADIFQEALLVFIEKVKTETFELTSSIKTYLYSVCRFMLYDKNRKGGKETSLETYHDVEVESDLEAKQQREQQFGFLEKILNELGDKCVEILQRYYYRKESMTVIAESLGYANVNTAKTQKYKCLERARKQAIHFNQPS
ncbi:MAG: sigma-70 family RNA polymerase sigma factor [Bacteroidetes bacterium]|nr:sigma-70 family RNA polymerase sigma factor [Bacteroidota bacterium]